MAEDDFNEYVLVEKDALEEYIDGVEEEECTHRPKDERGRGLLTPSEAFGDKCDMHCWRCGIVFTQLSWDATVKLADVDDRRQP